MSRPCEVCAQSGAFVPFPNRRKVPLERCPSCGFIRCERIPTPEDLSKLYTRDYYQSWGLEKDPGLIESMKRATFKPLVERLKRFSPSPLPSPLKGEGVKKSSPRPSGGEGQGEGVIRLLDVGCATGFLMAEAEAQGWESYGVEFSEFGASEAKKRFGARVFQGNLEQHPFPDQTFQAITLIDLLEHVPMPLEFLDLCRKRLVPGGLLAIGTPDTASLTARLFGGAWEHLKHEHLYYWSRANLERTLANHGFKTLWAGPLRKALNLEYVNTQLEIYPLPVATPVARGLTRVLPQSLRRKNATITIGEMLVIGVKEKSL